MPQGPVTEVGDDPLRMIEPVMDRLIIGDRAAPFLHAGQRVMVRMCHDLLPLKSGALVFEIAEFFVEIESDRPRGNIEDEFPKVAFAFFPSLRVSVRGSRNKVVQRRPEA